MQIHVIEQDKEAAQILQMLKSKHNRKTQTLILRLFANIQTLVLKLGPNISPSKTGA